MQAGLAALTLGALAVAIVPSLLPARSSKREIVPVSYAAPPIAPATAGPRTLDDLLALPVDDLTSLDIGLVNLLCVQGLPGTESLDLDHALATLDRWAERVRVETDRHLYRVTDPRYAEHYRNSEPYFRAEMLLQVLQQDLGVKYDGSAIGHFTFADPAVAFIHGMIPNRGQSTTDTPGGTCASMPVLYVAVGRRLGYPLKLVTTDSHIFVRWEGESHPDPRFRGRLNIEGAGAGFGSYEDDHYKEWPRKITDAQVAANRHLVPLTPPEELALFLASRGHCGEDNGHNAFAARCYENAFRYDTSRPAYQAWFMAAALRSGYEPVTPMLERLLENERRFAGVTRPAQPMDVDDFAASPSRTNVISTDPRVPLPGVTLPVVPTTPSFNQFSRPVQPDPFRSQP